MLLSMVGAAAPVSSEEPDTGLCEHHPEHTADCGYAAPTEGSPCLHVHDESCGYAEPVPETPCNMGCAETDENGVIIHAPGCAYTPAEEGSPCQYVCELCGETAPTDDPEPEPRTSRSPTPSPPSPRRSPGP